MRITSNILGEMASAVKRSLVGIFETDIIIPPIIQPITELRGVVQLVTTPGGNPVNNTVLVNGSDTITNNAGGSTLNVLVLRPGAWQLDYNVVYSSNYATTPSTGGQILFIKDTIASFLAICFTHTAGGVIAVQNSMKLNIDTQVTIQTNLFGNGVGQTHGIVACLLASKLT